jgi:hypothetical protein
LELFFGEVLRVTSHRPHCGRQDDSLPEAVDQTIVFINQCIVRRRLSGSDCHLIVRVASHDHLVTFGNRRWC